MHLCWITFQSSGLTCFLKHEVKISLVEKNCIVCANTLKHACGDQDEKCSSKFHDCLGDVVPLSPILVMHQQLISLICLSCFQTSPILFLSCQSV